MNLKAAFFGTPDFSASFFRTLIEQNPPVDFRLVVTQPDRPVGRDQISTPTPVKSYAQHLGIEVFDEENLGSLPNLVRQLDLDFALLFAYGKIITTELLTSFKLNFGPSGMINLHPSLLPKFRGASPVLFPLALGEKETGVSLIVMDELLDHGPLITNAHTEILPNETNAELVHRLSGLAIPALLPVLKDLSAGRPLLASPQREEEATFTRQISKDDGYLSFQTVQKALRGENLDMLELPPLYSWYAAHNTSEPSVGASSAELIHNLFRALMPWPGLWTQISVNGQDKRLKINLLHLENGHLVIDKVQLEGKNEVDFHTFTIGYPQAFT